MSSVTVCLRHDAPRRLQVPATPCGQNTVGRDPPGTRHSCRVARHPPDGDDLPSVGVELRRG